MRPKCVSSVCLVMLMTWTLTGCRHAAHQQPAKPQVSALYDDAGLPAGQYHIVGQSVRGRPIMAQVFGSGADTTLIMATIHGNEPAGTPLVRALADHLDGRRDILYGRTVILIATANPDGKAHRTRYNARGVDLNRNFPSTNRVNNRENGRTGLSEPEAAAIYQIIQQYHPDRIISIHQPLACVDYDGPAQDLAEQIAQRCDLPVRKLGARPGSLGSYSGETLGIPIVTLEMPGNDSRLMSAQLWNRYGGALIAAIETGTPDRHRPIPVEAVPVRAR